MYPLTNTPVEGNKPSELTKVEAPKEVVFVIEDDPDLQAILTYNLQKAGHAVQCFAKAEDVMKLVEAAPEIRPSALVVDINLAGRLNGLEALQFFRSRRQTSAIPVLMLTAKGEAEDIVKGLNQGADDYLPKPFEMEVFMARLKSCLRRGDKNAGPIRVPLEKLSLSGIDIDPISHKVEVYGKEVELTVTEFGLLSNLMKHPNQVLNRDDLLLRLVGPSKTVTARTIDVHVRALRFKLGKKAKHVTTVRGVGYKFVP